MAGCLPSENYSSSSLVKIDLYEPPFLMVLNYQLRGRASTFELLVPKTVTSSLKIEMHGLEKRHVDTAPNFHTPAATINPGNQNIKKKPSSCIKALCSTQFLNPGRKRAYLFWFQSI